MSFSEVQQLIDYLKGTAEEQLRATLKSTQVGGEFREFYVVLECKSFICLDSTGHIMLINFKFFF